MVDFQAIVKLRPKSVDELIDKVGNKAKSALGTDMAEQIEDLMRQQERAQTKDKLTPILKDVIVSCYTVAGVVGMTLFFIANMH